jgi:hypothetical protein
MEGHADACQLLLSRDDFEGVNAQDLIGSNALHFAAGNDQEDVCRLLLTCPRFTGTVNTMNRHGKTPLDFAREFSEGEAIPVLEAAANGQLEGMSQIKPTEIENGTNGYVCESRQERRNAEESSATNFIKTARQANRERVIVQNPLKVDDMEENSGEVVVPDISEKDGTIEDGGEGVVPDTSEKDDTKGACGEVVPQDMPENDTITDMAELD